MGRVKRRDATREFAGCGSVGWKPTATIMGSLCDWGLVAGTGKVRVSSRLLLRVIDWVLGGSFGLDGAGRSDGRRQG